MPRSDNSVEQLMPCDLHVILSTGPFLLLNGDMILKTTDIADLCTCHTPCMSTSTTDHPKDYGVVLVENDLVTTLEEKSKHLRSNQINAGAYFFSPDIFDVVDRVQTSSRGEFELTDALCALYCRKEADSTQVILLDGCRESLGYA